ncbi:alpha/beta hydrolase family protein [Dyella sp.]|uniref:alpha/beta hydrolase family protein n=1 Tax=Dyella sp. TaxID=1869338 RepID=UPI002ED1B2BA
MMLFRNRLAGLLVCLCTLTLPWAHAAHAPATGVGFQTLSIHDRVNDVAMPGLVFYPSLRASGDTVRGPYHIAATADAPVQAGIHPMVVISHGNGGSDMGHHDLATYLASHGFIVATLEHPGDNFHDQTGVGYPRVMGGRPIQVAETIDALLTSPSWKVLIDPDRIGVAGFSAGGYTALMVVGAKPRFDRFITYCKKYPGDHDVCDVTRRLFASAARRGQTDIDVAALLQKDSMQWGMTADPRVKAAFVMAPQSIAFDAAGAAAVDRPVYLYYAQNDHVLIPSENAEHLAPLLHTLAGKTMVPKADHWVFLAPCSPELARQAAVICSDPQGVDRRQVHARILADALDFFRKTLHVTP